MKAAKKISEKEVKVQFRSTPEEKAYFERVASRFGFKNLSEFFRVSAYEKARKELPDLSFSYERQLSAKDSLLLAEKLINPPEPNEKLKALFNKNKDDKFSSK